jgi:hypothetical protein
MNQASPSPEVMPHGTSAVAERHPLALHFVPRSRLSARSGVIRATGSRRSGDRQNIERSRLASRSSRKKFFDFLHQTFSEHRGVAQSVGIVAPHGKDTHRIFVP